MLNLVKWNPWKEMNTLPYRLNRLFDDPFFQIGPMDADGMGSWNPLVDLYERGDNYVIKAELPGMDKKDITIDVKDGLMTLSGERSYDNEVKEDHYYRRERSHGKFQRVFTLPADVDADKISATFQEGVLTIEIPKPEGAKAKQITVH
jgi:HSP20 family protein